MYLEIHKNAPKVDKRKWRNAAGDVAAAEEEPYEEEEERASKMNFALFRIINLKLVQS